jgi:hypothetical protein
MNLKRTLFTAVLLLGLAVLAARAAEFKLEAQLVWATSEASSPNPKHQPVEGDVARKLASLPLKWSHFFVENQKDFVLDETAAREVRLSEKCRVEVKSAGDNKVEVALFGNGKPVWKGVQPLPRGEILVLGGNAPGDSAWLVTLKRKE